jgi:uncharacterized protein YeaO (DUF488 family)
MTSISIKRIYEKPVPADGVRILVDRLWPRGGERGAIRLVVTGGGEPLLSPEVTLRLIAEGRRWFSEIACFTNGTYLTRELAMEMQSAGLSYLCYSRHHDSAGMKLTALRDCSRRWC